MHEHLQVQVNSVSRCTSLRTQRLETHCQWQVSALGDTLSRCRTARFRVSVWIVKAVRSFFKAEVFVRSFSDTGSPSHWHMRPNILEISVQVSADDSLAESSDLT
jgi:hypothetical protein